MSLNMIYKELDSTLETFFSDIKNQTGVTIDYKNSSSEDHLIITKITFSDGTYYENANIIDIGRQVEWIAMVDDSTHLFIITTQAMLSDMANKSTYGYMDYWHDVFVVELNGNMYDLTTSSYRFREIFNVPQGEANSSNASITLAPAYVNDGSSAPDGFIKNMYINYERKFQGGLKFIDQNGNRFVTIGCYLLYKVD